MLVAYLRLYLVMVNIYYMINKTKGSMYFFQRKQKKRSFIPVFHSILGSSEQTYIIQNIIVLANILTFYSLMGVSSNSKNINPRQGMN